jgi:hypothetical protein
MLRNDFLMNIDTEFQDIRPYRDHEFRKVMDNLLDSLTVRFAHFNGFPKLPG